MRAEHDCSGSGQVMPFRSAPIQTVQPSAPNPSSRQVRPVTNTDGNRRSGHATRQRCFRLTHRHTGAGVERDGERIVPDGALTAAVTAFQSAFPNKPLRISVAGMGGAIEPVLEKKSAFGIRGPLATDPPELTAEHLLGIRYQMVAFAFAPAGSARRPDPDAHAARAYATAADRQLAHDRGERPACVLAKDLAAVRPRSETRIPAGWLGLGRYAA